MKIVKDLNGENWGCFTHFTAKSRGETGMMIGYKVKETPTIKGLHQVCLGSNHDDKYYYIGIDYKKMLKDPKYAEYVGELIINNRNGLLSEEKPYNYIGHVKVTNSGLPFLGNESFNVIFNDEIIEWSKQQPYVIEQVEMAKQQPYVIEQVEMAKQRKKEAELDYISSIPKTLQKNRTKIQKLQDEVNELLKYEEQLTIEYINLCKAYDIPIADLDEIDKVPKTK